VVPLRLGSPGEPGKGPLRPPTSRAVLTRWDPGGC